MNVAFMTFEGADIDLETASVSEWETIDSAPPHRLRSNSDIHMAEVTDAGHIVALTGLSAIEEWADEHELSNTDKEKLVQADLAAAGTPFNVESLTGPSKEFETMSTSAPTPDNAPARTPAAAAIGSNMPKPDWQEVINRLQERAPGERGRVYLPKAGAEYAGKIMMVTDTHLVQQVGKASAIAHDLGRLDGGAELAGNAKVGMQASFAYGKERGTGRVMTFNEKRAEDVRKDLASWAEKNITNVKGRDTFIKHLDAATKELARPAAERAPAAAAPTKAGPAPERGR